MSSTLESAGLGEWIKQKRLERKLSLRELADLAGIAHSSLDKLERGGGARDSTVELLVGALAGPEASPEEAQELLLEARRVRAGLEPQEIKREPFDEDTLEVAHFYSGIADPKMKAFVKRMMREAVEIGDQEPEDAGPSGNGTD